MKQILITLTVFVLFSLIGVTQIYAWNQPAPTPVCDDGDHIGNPHCQTASPSPTNQPSISPSATPLSTPESTPTETASASATPITTSTPEATTSPTPNVGRTDLTDNKSDGHTESLGCLLPEDHCNTNTEVFAGIGGGAELPSTGNNSAYTTLAIGAGMLGLGLLLRAISRTI